MNGSFAKNGMFDTPVGKLSGRLTLDATDNLLELWGTKDVWPPGGITPHSPIRGLLEDQKRVFLPEFEWTRVGRTFGSEGETNRYSLSPLFAVVGTAPFSGEISRVSFKLDDAGAIFYDREAFGSLSFGKEKEARTVLRNAGIKIGPNVPYVSYWTGKSVILSVEASPGKVSVWNSPTLAATSETAVAGLTNSVVVSVEFPEPVTEMRELWKIVAKFTRFFGIIAGRPQNILALHVEDGEGARSEAYFPTFPSRSEDNEEIIRLASLVDAAKEPKNFSRFMANWFEKEDDDARYRARVRFFDGWSKQREYDVGRLIGAASMFDLLPKNVYPTARARLKSRVKHRAASIGHGLPEIDFVIDAAVELRNEYVHGPRPNKEPRAVSGKTLIFLTQTLEFVFAVAELHESGWDLQFWKKRPSSRHPLGDYVIEYERNLARLKEEEGRQRR